MTLNLKKLCVGANKVLDLYERQEFIRDKYNKTLHITRMRPKKGDELKDGGSMFWIIKGNIRARQRIFDLIPFLDDDGIKRCKILLSKNIYLTYPKKERPFQGWRYLESNDSPQDIKRFLFKENFEEEAIINELNSLGLL